MQDKIEGFKDGPSTSDISLENLSNQITRQMITSKQNTAYELLYLFTLKEAKLILSISPLLFLLF